MIYGGSMILPLRSGYTPELPRAVTVTTLPGGPSSQRRTAVTPITDITVQYLLSSCFMVEWYKAWYRRETLEGALPFVARLAIGGTPFADYNVQFAAAPTIAHAGYRGLLSCRYEVLSRV